MAKRINPEGLIANAFLSTGAISLTKEQIWDFVQLVGCLLPAEYYTYLDNSHFEEFCNHHNFLIEMKDDVLTLVDNCDSIRGYFTCRYRSGLTNQLVEIYNEAGQMLMEDKDDREEILMSKNFKIVKTKDIPLVDKEGNVNYDTHICKSFLEDENGEKVSGEYYYIGELGDGEHFLVCDVVSSQVGMEYSDEFCEGDLAFKYGVMSLKKDKAGNVIPMSEKIVVPIIYDRISPNNLKTVTAMNNGHCTYIELDPRSKNYGKQLVPAVLEHAVPFDVEYEGFAECSVNGVTGYLPRGCEPRTKLHSLDLLTKEQVEDLSSFLEIEDKPLHDSAMSKFSNLTGVAKIKKLTRN